MALTLADLINTGQRIESIGGSAGGEPQYDAWFQTPDGRSVYQRPDGTYWEVTADGLMRTYDPQGAQMSEFATGGGSFWDNTIGKHGLGQAGTDIANDPRLMAFLATAAGGAAASSMAGGAGAAGGGAGSGVTAADITAAVGSPELGLVANPATANAAIAGGIPASALSGGAGAMTLADIAAGKKTGSSIADLLGGKAGVVGTLGDLLGGYLGSEAAQDASRAQLDATKLGIDEVRRQYDLNRQDQMPWLDAGRGALGQLQERMPELTSRFTPDDLENDPGYQFQLKQGLDAITAAGRAGGSLDSGATLKALLEYGQGHAGQYYDQAFNRHQVENNSIYNMLAGLSGTGQTTAQQLGAAGTSTATTLADLLGQSGDATAAGKVGSANSWINALNGISNRTQQNSWMNALFGNRQGGASGGWSNFWS